MSSASTPVSAAAGSVRSLTPADFERVVEIDRELSGFSRRGFFEKRLRCAEAYPKAFASLGYEEDGVLEGFVMAQMLDGEFGGAEPSGILDAIGTAAKVRGHGGARALLGKLVEKLKARGAKELRTQLRWQEQPLIRFFASAGFELSPSLVLSRSCAKQEGEIAPGDPARRARTICRATAFPSAPSTRPAWQRWRPSTGGLPGATARPITGASSTRC